VIASSDFEIYLVPCPSEAKQDFNNAGCLPIALLPAMLHFISLKFLHQYVARMFVYTIRRNRGPNCGQQTHPRQNFNHYGQDSTVQPIRQSYLKEGGYVLLEHEERTVETRRGLHNRDYHIYTFVWLCMSKDWDWGARFRDPTRADTGRHLPSFYHYLFNREGLTIGTASRPVVRVFKCVSTASRFLFKASSS
jgi:hypothetical protein